MERVGFMQCKNLNRKFSWLGLVLFGALSLMVPAQAEVNLNVHKEVLPNGLTVLLHPNKQAPTVSCRLFYVTGSVHEVPGKSGLAHILEHELFKGTKKVGITEGLFGFTFNEDGTMAMQYGSKTFPGTWTLDKENATINMKMAKFLNIKGYIAVKNNKMELLFDVTSLMRLVKSVTSVYKNATLQTISDLLNQYDKMYAGFNLVK